MQLQLSIATATCRKTCLSQIVLLQYKAKPYLGFQNLGCHCKILGCHFDTHKRLKKTLVWIFCARNLVFCFSFRHSVTSVKVLQAPLNQNVDMLLKRFFAREQSFHSLTCERQFWTAVLLWTLRSYHPWLWFTVFNFRRLIDRNGDDGSLSSLFRASGSWSTLSAFRIDIAVLQLPLHLSAKLCLAHSIGPCAVERKLLCSWHHRANHTLQLTSKFILVSRKVSHGSNVPS